MSSYRPSREASCSYPPPPLTASYVYVENRANEILETCNVTGMANLVTNLFHGKETDESSSSKLLYESFTEHFPTRVVLKLLQVYRFACVTSKIRLYSLTLLELQLINLGHSRVELNRKTYFNIKAHLYSLRADQDILADEFELLSRIVDRVFLYLFVAYIPRHKLCSYIISLDWNKKALMFSILPMVFDEEFLMPLLENGLHGRIVKGLFNPDSDEDWGLALDAGFNLILQLVGKKRDHLIIDLVYATVHSVWEMVNIRGKEIVVREGFVRIARKVSQEAVRFREAEYEVVKRIALMLKKMNGIGEATEMAAKRIHEILNKYYKPLNLDLV